MKIGIIDDDKEFAEVLNKELEQLFSQVQIKKYQEISDELYKEEFDILFLDVLLYDKKSFNEGEKILTVFPHTTLCIYFYVLNILSLKCIKQKTFYFVRKSNLYPDLKEFYKKYNQSQLNDKQILTIKGDIDILQCEIIYINSSKNTATIHTTYNKYIIKSSLKEILTQLDQSSFFRFNSYTIINFRLLLMLENNIYA